MIDFTVFVPLLIMGLVSSAHCIGMCGGIMGALSMAIPPSASTRRWVILSAYNLGRITSYTIMGLLAGFFAAQFAALGGAIVLRVLAGLLLMAMGLYLADWWRGITVLETVGRYLWVYIQPIGKSLMPVNTIGKAFALGVLWGWLPCGLVYAAMAMAMTQPQPIMAAIAMCAFGLGTLPAVLAAGVAAQQLTRILQTRKLRMVLAIIVIGFGIWTLWAGVAHGGHKHHHLTMAGDAMAEHSMADHSMHHDGIDHKVLSSDSMNHTDMNHAEMHHHLNTDSNMIMDGSYSSMAASSLDASKDTVQMHHH